LYLAGLSAEAVELGTEAARVSRTSGNTNFTIHAPPHFAISLAAVGRYSGQSTCSKRPGISDGMALWGRSPLDLIRGGLHLSIFDFKG
jgi:hypothetical protein